MKPVDSFRKIEDEELRGDKYEGISKIWNYPAGEFEIPAINFKGQYISLHLCERFEIVLGNIYSLYCISSHGFADPSLFKIDERMKRFGSHILMIKDNPAFLNLIRKNLKSRKIPYREGFVEYYHKNKINGEIDILQKSMEFEYQKEFRIFAYQKECTPLILKLGSLEAISEILPIHAVDSFELTSNHPLALTQ
ncbi:MAG: hypothetical protein Q8L07_03130 [Sediminibacterium sp.]|nr:hypothetical protein [Sediminibacterium sp.]